jgi:hypothetical protein
MQLKDFPDVLYKLDLNCNVESLVTMMSICFERFPKWSNINPPFIDAHLQNENIDKWLMQDQQILTEVLPKEALAGSICLQKSLITSIRANRYYA